MESQELLHIQGLVKALGHKIDELKQQKQPVKDTHRSESIQDLALALAKAQAEFTVAGKNKLNPYFKSSYADLESVVDASRPALTKYGLSVSQIPMQLEDGLYLLITILMHGATGQYIQSQVRIVPPKNDIQSISSYITYTKRICYAALVGVVAGDEDDDGEAAVATSRDVFARGVALNHSYNPKENVAEFITKEQLEQMELELKGFPDITEDILDGFKIQSLANTPKSKFYAAIERIRQIKKIRKGE